MSLNQQQVFIIAEISANHQQNLEVAIETIRAAKRAGADAVKLQTYTPDTMTLDSDKNDFLIQQGTIWDGQKLYNLYQEAYTPWEWHAKLFEVAKEEGLICFSSPFDKTAVDLLETLNCPIYKIASFEITDLQLIEYTAAKGKPMILSTGIAERIDIERALEVCRKAGNNDITLLKCTSSYPAPMAEANMRLMQQFATDFGVKIGLSDHTLGITLPIVSVALGATVIEKHFIIDRAMGGPDATFSLDVNEFTAMVNAVRDAEKSLGSATYELTEKQRSGKAFSRSLYVAEDIRAGDIFTEKNIRCVRPGFGMHPRFYPEVLGKKAVQNLEKGSRLTPEAIHDFS